MFFFGDFFFEFCIVAKIPLAILFLISYDVTALSLESTSCPDSIVGSFFIAAWIPLASLFLTL
jgi:hypothetical protein